MPRATGKGRVAAFEIMHNTPAVSNLIREGKTERITSVIQTSAKVGMVTLDDYLLRLLQQHIISGEVCLERAQNYEEMRKAIMARAVSPEEEGDVVSIGDTHKDQALGATGQPSEEY